MVAAKKSGTSMSSISYQPISYRITMDGKMSTHNSVISR